MICLTILTYQYGPAYIGEHNAITFGIFNIFIV